MPSRLMLMQQKFESDLLLKKLLNYSPSVVSSPEVVVTCYHCGQVG